MMFGWGSQEKNWITKFAAAGANACRPNKFSNMSDSDIFAMCDAIEAAGMVVYLIPKGGNGGFSWFGNSNVQQNMQKRKNLVIDALLEPTADPSTSAINSWRSDVKTRVQQMRDWGYKHLISIHAMQYGRRLKEVLQYGQEFVDADPLHNVLMGWQWYWPNGGYEWQADQGFGSGDTGQKAAALAVSKVGFPVQAGLALGDENKRPNPVALQLQLAKQYGIGWLHWDGYEDNPQDVLWTDSNLTKVNPPAAGILAAMKAEATKVTA
jgi:hypothetical protein